MRPPLDRRSEKGVRVCAHESRPAAGAELTGSLTIRPTGGKADGPAAHAGTAGTLDDTAHALLDQLHPCCEIVDHADTCPHAAGWIVWVTAPWLLDCPKMLACERHKALSETHHATCSHCRGWGITFHAEPLR